MPPLELRLIIRAENQMGPGLAQMRQELQALQRDLANVTQSGIQPMTNAVRSLGERVKDALIFFGAFRAFWSAFNFIRDRIKDLFELEQQLKRVQSATIFDSAGLLGFDAALKLLTTNMVRFGLSAKEVGNAIFELISAGLTTADTLKLIPTVLGLVKAGVSDIGTASRAAAAIFKTWGVDATQLGDTLAFVLNQSQVEINGLVTGLQRAAGTARVAGLTFEQTAVALAVLNDGMIFGGNAGRAFRRGLEQIVTETTFLEERFGIVIDRTRDVGSQFDSIISQLGARFKQLGGKEALGALAEQFSKFGILGVQAIAVLTAFSDRYEELLRKVRSGEIEGSLQKIVAIRMDTAIEQFNRLQAAITAAFPISILDTVKGFSSLLANVAHFGSVVGTQFFELTKHALSFVALQGAILTITEKLKSTTDTARRGELQAALQERTRQLEIDRTRALELFEALRRTAPELEDDTRSFLQALGLIPQEIQKGTREAERLEQVWRVLSEKTFQFAANLKDVSIDERRTVITRRLTELYDQLSERTREILEANKGTVEASNLQQLNLRNQADREAFITALLEKRLATREGDVQFVQKQIEELVKLTNEEERLRGIQQQGLTSLIESSERLGEAEQGRIDLQSRLNFLKTLEVRLQQELQDLLKTRGIEVEAGPGQLPALPLMEDFAGLFGEKELKRLLELYRELSDILSKQLRVRQQITEATIKPLEAEARVVQARLALQLRTVDVEEKIARATTIISDQDAKRFGQERLAAMQEALTKLLAIKDALQAQGVVGKTPQETAKHLEDVGRLLDQIDLLREKMRLVELSQKSLFDAFVVGIREGINELVLTGQRVADLGRELVRGFQRTLSEGIFDVLTKGFKGTQDFFLKLRDTVLRFLADLAASKILQFFGGAIFGGEAQAAKEVNISAQQVAVTAGSVILSGVTSGTLPPGSFQIASAGDSFPFPADFGKNAEAASDGMGAVADSAKAAGGTLSFLGRIFALFGSTVAGVIQFIGSLLSGIGLLFSGGSAAAGIVGGAGGGGLGGILGIGNLFGGLATTLVSKLFDFVGSLVSDLGLGSLGGAIGELAFFAPQIVSNVIPIIGTAIAVIMDFVNGNIRGASLTAAGAIIGSFIPGIGTVVGAIIGKLVDIIIGFFEGPPTARLYVQLQSTFDRTRDIYLKGITKSFGAHVSADMPDADANKIRDAIVDALDQILRQLLGALVKAQAVLPTSLTDTMNRRLSELAARSPFLAQGETEFNLEKPEELKRAIEALPNKLITLFSEAIFGGLDITKLQRPGEALGDTFARVLNSMVGFSEIVRLLGGDVDALVASMGTGDEALKAFVQRSLAFFEQFAKEGEKFEDTLKRVMEGIVGLITLRDDLTKQVVDLTGGVVEQVTLLQSVLAKADAAIQRMADALTVAIESGAQPDEILTQAQELTNAVVKRYQTEINLVKQLQQQIDQLSVSFGNFILDLTEQINALLPSGGGAASGQGSLQEFVRLVERIIAGPPTGQMNQAPALSTSALAALFPAVAGTLGTFPGTSGMLAGGVNALLPDIQAMTNPEEALTALQHLSEGVQAYLQAQTQMIQQQTQQEIAAIQAAGQARLASLNAEKQAIQDAGQLRIDALNAELSTLQDELRLAQQWSSVVQSVKDQLLDLFNLMAPTQPLTSLQAVQEQFRTAFAAFQAGPTPELAQQVQTLGQQVIQLAQGVPGFDLPSLAFQGVVDEVTAALEAIRSVAEAQPSQEAIQARIADLTAQIKDIQEGTQAAVRAVDAQIAQLNADTQTAIQAAQASGDAQIAALNAQMGGLLTQIREIALAKLAEFTEQQRLTLEAITGGMDVTLFIAQKNREMADSLSQIRDKLDAYLAALLGTIVPTPAPAIPGLQHGTPYVPRTDLYRLHEGEMVLPRGVADWVRSGTNSSEVVINLGGITIHVADGRGVNARRLADEIEEAVLDKLKVGRIRDSVKEIARRV